LAQRPETGGERRPGPGRPPTGARERILKAGLEVLKSDGYAGLTTAKVAARSGQNKALIGYHFGSKHGLVAEVAHEVAESITEEVVGRLERIGTVEELIRGVLDGLWRMMERDERLARLYFDLAAASVVEPEVKAVMRDMKDGWRATLGELLTAASDGPAPRRAEAATVYVIAGLEGLALERLARGETRALRRARELFVTSAAAAVRRSPR
jgi:AcrR family transcriptional regulator